MSKHTPEPWKISHDDSDEEWSVITNNSGSIVANVNGRTGPELVGDMPVDRVMPAEDNARRIVACVNACTGIRTEALEHRAHMLNAHDDTIAELKRQRDELLALAERLVQWDLDYPVNCYNGYAGLQALNAIIRDNKVAITKGSAS